MSISLFAFQNFWLNEIILISDIYHMSVKDYGDELS